jgi:hypothetical protein
MKQVVRMKAMKHFLPMPPSRSTIPMAGRPVIFFIHAYITIGRGSAQCVCADSEENSRFLRQSPSSISSECGLDQDEVKKAEVDAKAEALRGQHKEKRRTK